MKSVELKVDSIEHLEIQAGEDIIIRVYEDGLVTLSDRYHDIKEDVAKLKAYFTKDFAPMMYYLFSTGAPIPKDLAGMDTTFPCFIVAENIGAIEAHRMLIDLKAEPYYAIKAEGVDIYRDLTSRLTS